jgi:hypothetical protein
VRKDGKKEAGAMTEGKLFCTTIAKIVSEKEAAGSWRCGD